MNSQCLQIVTTTVFFSSAILQQSHHCRAYHPIWNPSINGHAHCRHPPVQWFGLRRHSCIDVGSIHFFALPAGHCLAPLERIRHLYPRTASRLFANLTAVLTEKLIKADTFGRLGKSTIAIICVRATGAFSDAIYGRLKRGMNIHPTRPPNQLTGRLAER
jgi:hypothetical protein